MVSLLWLLGWIKGKYTVYKFNIEPERATGLAEWLRRWTKVPMDESPRGFETHTQYILKEYFRTSFM